MFAAPTIAALAELDSIVLEKRGFNSITEPYNQILDEVAGQEGLEAVVLMHQDTRILEPRFLELVRHRLADPKVGMVGGYGGRRCPPGANWWDGDQLGRTYLPTAEYEYWASEGPHYADVADGYLLAVSPPVARSVRFNENLRDHFHGYDVDFSFQVRARGYRIVVDDFANQHASPGAPPDDSRWPRAAEVVRRRWNPQFWPAEWRGSEPYGFFG